MRFLVFLVGLSLLGQTRVDLSRQSKVIDFTNAPHTRPIQVGTVFPATCAVGELFFYSPAPAGGNLYGCAATNLWSSLGGSGQSLGACTINLQNQLLRCPGGFVSGDGSSAGEMLLYDISNLTNYISWLAPDAIVNTYRLQLPPSAPADGQVLMFNTPANGIAAGTWSTMERMNTSYFTAAQGDNGTWRTGPGWSLANDGSGATVSGGGNSPFQRGYISFPASSKRYANLQGKLPLDWDGSGASARLIWSVDSTVPGLAVNWGVAAACVGDGASAATPVFGAEQAQTALLLYHGDNTHKRMSTILDSLSLLGCKPGDSLFLMISRDGVQDDFSGPVFLYGLEVATRKSF